MDIVNNVKSSSHRIRNSFAAIFGIVVLAGCDINCKFIFAVTNHMNVTALATALLRHGYCRKPKYC
jgi:hypothetical protein